MSGKNFLFGKYSFIKLVIVITKAAPLSFIPADWKQ